MGKSPEMLPFVPLSKTEDHLFKRTRFGFLQSMRPIKNPTWAS